MIRSMTGFGRALFEVDGTAFQVEIRSVNHRHLDVQLRLPRALGAFEAELRPRIRRKFGRGKIEVSIGLRAGGGPAVRVEIDPEAASGYVEAARALVDAHGVRETLEVGALLALPGVIRLVEAELTTDAVRAALAAAVDEACDAALAMRRAEGEVLDREIRERLGSVVRLLGALADRSELVQRSVRERLRKRAEQLERETGLLDEARLHQEVVLAADRLDVNEEIVRLRSHVEQFESALGEPEPAGPVGRRLDFLLQEMAREANTVGSKGSDAPIAHLVVDLKTDLERIREQVQNVE